MATFRRLGQFAPEIKINRAPRTSDGVQLSAMQIQERSERLRASKKRTADLTNAILLRLNLCGFVAWRNNSIPSQVTRITVDAQGKEHRSSRYKSNNVFRGTFDIIGFRTGDGRHLEIEVKTGKDKPSPEQLVHYEKLKKSGAIAFFIGTLDEFEILIKPFLR